MEGGMIALMIMLGFPASVGVSIMLMDRGIVMGVNPPIGGGYAVRLLQNCLHLQPRYQSLSLY